MSDYVLVCYPSDPIRPGETVNQKMMGYDSPWEAIYEFAEFMRKHPNPMIPTRIDVLSLEDWRAKKAEGEAREEMRKNQDELARYLGHNYLTY